MFHPQAMEPETAQNPVLYTMRSHSGFGAYEEGIGGGTHVIGILEQMYQYGIDKFATLSYESQ